MHVDETGSDHLAGGVDHARALSASKISDSDYASVTDSNIGFEPRISRAVDYVAASDDDVVRLRENTWTSRDQNGEQKTA
jgi:hypothetical protein